MLRNTLLLAGLAAALIPAPAVAWGPLGHRVSADIAERNINGCTRARIAEVAGTITLRQLSTLPDEQRNNPDQFWQGAASWHRVVVPRPGTIADRTPRAGGDAVEALEWGAATLRDRHAAPLAQQRALAFVVHLVADTHLPVHFEADRWRGGDFSVNWFGEPQSMHWAFEEGLPGRKLLSASEYAEQLEGGLTPALRVEWWTPEPTTWMNESLVLREALYAFVEAEPTEAAPLELGYGFVYQWTPAMERRLAQAGIRLAAHLDWIFAPVC